jgi:protein-tyrosine phosphatase
MKTLALALALAVLFSAPLAARVSDPAVDRDAQGQWSLHWQDTNPVDVYRIAAPSGKSTTAPQLVAGGIANGQLALPAPAHERGWFLLKDRRDHTETTVAERLLPLEQGSNFRDLGGYPGWGGKHVRWGMLYRSGATPLLTPGDLAQIRALGLQQMIDLRSSEERVLAPTRIAGVSYGAVGYSFQDMTKGGPFDMATLYRNFPEFLKPQLKLILANMLRGDVPIAYNCSAGQDRTGFATAMILSALGVPRATILADYLLSTQYRHPEFEMPPIDAAQHPGDPVAQMFSHAGGARKPAPLLTAAGQPYLTYTFEQIDRTWGSTDGYLKSELGIGPVELAILRQRYLQ